MAEAGKKGQKGAGSKSHKDPGASSRRNKRKRHHARAKDKKDLRVFKSSHGKFASVHEFETHKQKVSQGKG